MVDIQQLVDQVNQLALRAMEWTSSPDFYTQLSLVLVAIFFAYLLSAAVKKHAPIFRHEPESGPILALRKRVHELGDLVFPLYCIVALSVANEISSALMGGDGFTRVAQGMAILVMLYSMIARFVNSPMVALVFKWGLLPIAALHVFGLLDETIALMDRISVQIGNIHISATGVFRVVIFGSILFWLGRLSNNAGKQVIRAQENIDFSTRELFAKLFEVTLYMVIFVLLLQVMGVNLTALAVFGGALGVGLGFGLQAIASNFISGVIILLDRSISVGDFIEMDDGRSGTIRSLNMRYTLLETYEGKDIMVPNEQFITSSFTNWTHTNQRQRYSLNFSVAYDTDIEKVVELVRAVVRTHEQVLSGDDYPYELQPVAI